MPASILVAVLAHLPRLRALRLKGAPSGAILDVLALLPRLVALDTDYFGGARAFGRGGLLGAGADDADAPAAALHELTVRTSSVDVQGLPQLWPWIRRLTPRAGLAALTLNAFSTQGEALIPRGFILDMATVHRDTLRHFTADWTQMTCADIECLCTVFPALETLSCLTMWSPDGVGGFRRFRFGPRAALTRPRRRRTRRRS